MAAPRILLAWNVPLPERMLDPLDIEMMRAGIPLEAADRLLDASLFRVWAKMSLTHGVLRENLDYVQLMRHADIVKALHDIHEPTMERPAGEWGREATLSMDAWLESAGAQPAEWAFDEDGRVHVTPEGFPFFRGAPPTIGMVVAQALAGQPDAKWLPMDCDFHGVSPYFAAYRMYDPRPEVTTDITINMALGETMGIPTLVPPFQWGHGHPWYGAGFRWDDVHAVPLGLVPIDPRWSFGAKASMMEFHAHAMDWTWGLLKDGKGKLCLVFENGNGLGAKILDESFVRRIHAGFVGPAFIAEVETDPPAMAGDCPTAWRLNPVRHERLATLGIPEGHAGTVRASAQAAMMAGDLLPLWGMKRAAAAILVPGAFAQITKHALTLAKGFHCSEVGLLTGRGTILSGHRPGWAAWHDPWHGFPNGVYGPFQGPDGMEAHLVADIDGPGCVIDMLAMDCSRDFAMFRRLNGGGGPESTGILSSWDRHSHQTMGCTSDSLRARLAASETSACAPWRVNPDIPRPDAVDFRVIIVLSAPVDGRRHYDAHVTRAGLVRGCLKEAPAGEEQDWFLAAARAAWPQAEADVSEVARLHFTLRAHEDAFDHPKGIYPPWTKGWLDPALASRAGHAPRWCEEMASYLMGSLADLHPEVHPGASEAFWRAFDAPHHLHLPQPLTCPYEPPTVMRWMEWMPLLRIHYIWSVLWRGYAIGRYVTTPETVLGVMLSTHASHAAWASFWGDLVRPEADAGEASFWMSRTWWEDFERRTMEPVGDPGRPWDPRYRLKPELAAMSASLPDSVRCARSDADMVLAARSAGLLDGTGASGVALAAGTAGWRFVARLTVGAWSWVVARCLRIPRH